MYLFIYTPLKKLTWLNTPVGAIPGAIPPIGGWVAASGSLDPEAWILFAILFLWQHPHFYAIAYMYKDDYEKADLKMLTVVEPDGKYGEKVISQVRVLERGRYEIHRRDEKKGEYKLFDEGEMSLKDKIPFAVAYSNRVGFYESRSPLYDIAELNLKHYQIQSDLDNILHISSVPLLAVFGYPNADEITTGPSEALSLPPESRMEYISPSGDSYDSQFKRLDDIKDQINTLSLAAVLGQKLVGETAEAKQIDRSQNDSTMMVVAQQMQDLIDNCLKFHSEYLNEPNAGSSFVNRDFVTTRLEPQEIQSLLALFTAGTISQETLLTQLSSGEILGDDFSVEEEIMLEEDNERMDIIGQNGNDGLHYDLEEDEKPKKVLGRGAFTRNKN